MKVLKILTILVLILTFTLFTVACGDKDAQSSGQQTDEQNQTVEGQSAGNTEPDQTAVVSKVMETADPKASVDSLIGYWTNLDSPDQFAKITKAETGYEYEDNEGKYPATFKDGVLRVKVSDSESDNADVYIDISTGHMLAVFQGNIAEYRKGDNPGN